ncbi:MAG: PPC domain-containing protein, partial [Acidobacteriota bacterium]|nr:PPC domain-containing protein [Acidobacteriota bacterium]
MRLAVGLLLLTAISALALTRGWGEAPAAAQSSTPKKIAPARGPRGRPLPPESFGAKKSDIKAAQAPQTPPVSPQVHGCPFTTSISLGQTVNASLSATDCRRVPEDRYFDAYTFTVSDGQRVAISMSSASFDTYLALFDANDNLVADNDDIAANDTNSRITQPLPGGTYLIFASSFEPLRTGNYSLTLAAGTDGACTRPPSVEIFTGRPVQGTLSTSDCQEEGFHYDTYTFFASVGQQVAINLSGDFDAYLLLVGPNGEVLAEDDNGGGGTNARIPQGTGFGYLPFTGTYAIIVSSSQPEITGNYSISFTGSPTGCSSTPISIGQTINGSLSTSDCRLVTDGSFIDVYTFNGTLGQPIAISLTGAFDAYLILLNPDGSPPAEDDNGGGGTNARLPASGGFLTLPATGTYTILANSSAPNQTGDYMLSLSGT